MLGKDLDSVSRVSPEAGLREVGLEDFVFGDCQASKYNYII
jgi:hypothetical protein